MKPITVGIAGAGLLGRLLAWRLARAGWRVDVFDPAPGPGPRFGDHGTSQHAAGFTAAGMLSPRAESEHGGEAIAALGRRSIAAWRGVVQALDAKPAFSQRGSLLLAHRGDRGAAQRMLGRIGGVDELSTSALAALEPSLQGAAHAWLLPDEAQIDPVATLLALQAEAGAQWHWAQRVEQVAPGRLVTGDGRTHRFDWVFDVRGTGAPSVRGVRGETVWLRLPSHGLSRPLRLLHPRHRVYVVPRSPELLLLGATEIESEDRSEVSLRSAVELMSAAHSVMPALAEARIVRLDSNLRPALGDNLPRVEVDDGLVRINGLYRHGWLLAPALVDDALARMPSGMQAWNGDPGWHPGCA
ncbi:FAD-dependent oxidoreductase [Piscinibacter sp. XHJ-5]|uniref:FAD-dependent oxidoreductase n=1 Tax=Piscinibacter sp. XHJ-5 TaxID=3037797 RepID=UPI00245319E7|nr:FAD-dependent oxidoreductase [Piscinibacter sp. XHJ-5]